MYAIFVGVHDIMWVHYLQKRHQIPVKYIKISSTACTLKYTTFQLQADDHALVYNKIKRFLLLWDTLYLSESNEIDVTVLQGDIIPRLFEFSVKEGGAYCKLLGEKTCFRNGGYLC